MTGFNRNAFKINKSQAKTYEKNNKQMQREYRADYINWDNIKIPLYKEIVCKDEDSYEENILTILPYVIKTRNNMWVATGKMPIGAPAYLNRVVRHGGVGRADTDILCNKAMYGRSCSFCSQRTELYRQNNVEGYRVPDNLGFVKSSTRDFYLVKPQLGEQAGQVCLWEASNFLFTQPFDDALLDYTRTTERKLKLLFEQQQSAKASGQTPQGKMLTEADLVVSNIADPDNGYDVRFMVKGKGTSKKYTNFNFPERMVPVTDDDLIKTFDISEHFIITENAKVDELLTESLDMMNDEAHGVETIDNQIDPAMQAIMGSETPTAPMVTVPAETTSPAVETTQTIPPVAEPMATMGETSNTAPNDSPITSPCPHNIAVKGSDFHCVTCLPDYKDKCERN